MDDLISRQAAIDSFPEDSLVWDISDGYIAPHYVRKILESLPSAEPEIIRCKDCKYWREHKYAKETKRYIPFCGFNAINTKADDYCSYAERRTDGKNT